MVSSTFCCAHSGFGRQGVVRVYVVNASDDAVTDSMPGTARNCLCLKDGLKAGADCMSSNSKVAAPMWS